MQFGRALVAAVKMHVVTGTYPIIVGVYGDGTHVRVRRAEEPGHGCINTSFTVEIASAVATTQPTLCDGMHNVRALLQRQGLPISGADWTTEAAVPAVKGGAP